MFVVLLVLLPFLANKGERSPWRRPWALGVVLVAVIMISTLWIAGEQAAWSPNLQAQAAQQVPPQWVGSIAFDSPIAKGARLFQTKGCVACHTILGNGGARGPDLTYVGDRLSKEQLTTRILNGGNNMPAFGSMLTPGELDQLVAFLQSRKSP